MLVCMLVHMQKYGGVSGQVKLQKRVAKYSFKARHSRGRTSTEEDALAKSSGTNPHAPALEAPAPIFTARILFFLSFISLLRGGRTCAIFIEAPVFHQQLVAAHSV